MIIRVSIILLALATPSWSFADPCGRVLIARGLVEVIHARPHKILQAKSGDTLICGDIVITKGKKSSAALEFSRGKMLIGSRTRIEIASADKVEEQSLDKEVDAVNLIYGISRTLIMKRIHDGPRFEVRTPAAVVGVRGTDFFVSHDSTDHVTREATLQGLVEVSRHDSKEMVNVASGQEISVSEGDEGKPRPPSEMSVSSKVEIKTMSQIAQYDPDFTHKEAIGILGKPEDWSRSTTDNYRRDSWKGSELLHQALEQKIELTPLLTLGSMKQHLAGNSSASSDFLMNVSIAGEYGINKMFSTGLKLAYAYEAFSFADNGGSGKASGPMDPVLFFKGLNHAGPGLVRYGSTLSVSPGKRTWTTSGNSTTGNEFSDGITFNAFGGYEMLLGPGAIGGRLSADLVQTDRKSTVSANGADADATEKGGQTMALLAYYEFPVNEWTWGADLGFVNFSSATEIVTINGVSGSQNGYGSQLRPRLDLYGFCRVSEKFSVQAKGGLGPGDDFLPNLSAGSGSGLYGMAGVRLGL